MRLILSVVLVVIWVQIARGQDIIIKRSGDEIEAKVLEITLEVVKYKTHDNLEGPTISVKIDDLFMIKYENGTKHVFKDEEPEKETEAEPDEGYTITYSKESEKASTVTYSRLERKEKDIGIYHALKVAPLLIFNGEIPIFYERRVGDHLSIEMGVGITHADYFYQGIFEEVYSSADRETKFGYSFSGSLRYFPSNYRKAIDEMYFGPDIRIKHYNTTLLGCDGILLESPLDETRDVVDYKISGGYVYWVGDRIVFDLYAGIGIRTKVIYEGYCDYSSPVTTVVAGTSKSTGPAVSLGFKFGFGF